MKTYNVTIGDFATINARRLQEVLETEYLYAALRAPVKKDQDNSKGFELKDLLEKFSSKRFVKHLTKLE